MKIDSEVLTAIFKDEVEKYKSIKDTSLYDDRTNLRKVMGNVVQIVREICGTSDWYLEKAVRREEESKYR